MIAPIFPTPEDNFDEGQDIPKTRRNPGEGWDIPDTKEQSG
jgi:hypothetical protein